MNDLSDRVRLLKGQLRVPGYVTATEAANARLILDAVERHLHLCGAPDLLDVLRRLTFAARTSGGTAGPDADLRAACDAAEALLSTLS